MVTRRPRWDGEIHALNRNFTNFAKSIFLEQWSSRKNIPITTLELRPQAQFILYISCLSKSLFEYQITKYNYYLNCILYNECPRILQKWYLKIFKISLPALYFTCNYFAMKLDFRLDLLLLLKLLFWDGNPIWKWY